MDKAATGETPQPGAAHGNLTELISTQARLRPAAAALVFGQRVLRYDELEAAIWSVAAELAARGVSRGDVVGIAMGNSPRHLIVLLALARMGAVSVPVHAVAPRALRQAIVSLYGVKTVIARNQAAAVDGVPVIVPEAAWTRHPDSVAPSRVAMAPGGEQPWRIKLSSGTTGVPKGVLSTHADALTVLELRRTVVRSEPDTRYLAAMDLNTTANLWRVLRHLLYGSAVVITRPSPDAGGVLAAIVEHQVTHAFVSPQMVRRWLDAQPAEARPLASLVHLAVGGGPMDESLRRDAMRRLTPNLYAEYGSTETTFAAIADPQTRERYPGCAGRLVPWIEAQSVDDRDTPLPAGATGLLRFRGAGVATSYYRNPAATAQMYRDGWTYTGDTGSVNAEGILFVGSRADDVINLGGTKVAPLPVEQALLGHPDIVEAAAFGATDPAGRIVLAAAVVTRRPVAERQLLDYARTQLGANAPQRIVALRELPRNASGKVLRRELAQGILQPATPESPGDSSP